MSGIEDFDDTIEDYIDEEETDYNELFDIFDSVQKIIS